MISFSQLRLYDHLFGNVGKARLVNIRVIYHPHLVLLRLRRWQ